jgi:hypothetical protein
MHCTCLLRFFSLSLSRLSLYTYLKTSIFLLRLEVRFLFYSIGKKSRKSFDSVHHDGYTNTLEREKEREREYARFTCLKIPNIEYAFSLSLSVSLSFSRSRICVMQSSSKGKRKRRIENSLSPNRFHPHPHTHTHEHRIPCILFFCLSSLAFSLCLQLHTHILFFALLGLRVAAAPPVCVCDAMSSSNRERGLFFLLLLILHRIDRR